jgi:hypothetical protein
MITNGVDYTDLGADYFQLRQDRKQTTTRLISKLTQLGYRVTLEDTTTTASTQNPFPDPGLSSQPSLTTSSGHL